jgi:hypothetical protein
MVHLRPEDSSAKRAEAGNGSERFTPGPWTVEFPQDARKPAIIRASNQEIVARVSLNGPNAHLMTAAPDLYAALLLAFELLPHEATAVAATCYAAICKARGDEFQP